MPYSALHAMMCCHTNESDPPFPRPSVFLDSQRVRFLDFFILSISFPFRLFSFSQRWIDPDLRIKRKNKQKYVAIDWNAKTVKETPRVSSRTKEKKHPPDKKERKKTKKTSHIRCSVVLCVIVSSFLSFPSFSIRSRAGTSSFVMYKTEM